MAYAVRSKVKALAKKKKMSFGADAATALDAEIARVVERAAQRARENRRSTIKGRDI
jgi:histone H3/H4